MLHVRGVPMQGVCRSKGEAGGAANSPPAAHTSPKPALDIPDTKHYRKHWKSSEFSSGMYNVHASAQLIFDEYAFPFSFVWQKKSLSLVCPVEKKDDQNIQKGLRIGLL